MEDLENEYDKGIYWVIFFVVLILIAIIGHSFVFNRKASSNDEKEIVETPDEDDYLEYKGIWQLFGDDDLPEQELSINIIDGSTITFDYAVKGVERYESQVASLEDDSARFKIEDLENDVTISGKMVFKNNKVFLIINSSNLDGIAVGTVEFSEKGEESLLD